MSEPTEFEKRNLQGAHLGNIRGVVPRPAPSPARVGQPVVMRKAGDYSPLTFPPAMPAEKVARAHEVARDVAATRAAFERAVVEDFAGAAAAYFAWTDAMHRSNQYGFTKYNDIPRFGEAVDQILYRAAIARREQAEQADLPEGA